MGDAKPYRQVVEEFAAERGMSIRAVARLIKAKTDWGTQTALWLYMNKESPTRKALVNTARAFNIEPEVIQEYRLLKARDQLDPDRVGLRKALANLEDAPALAQGHAGRGEAAGAEVIDEGEVEPYAFLEAGLDGARYELRAYDAREGYSEVGGRLVDALLPTIDALLAAERPS